MLLRKTYICGTWHLDRGVTKEMKKKIKYLREDSPITVVKPSSGTRVVRRERCNAYLITTQSTDCGDRKEKQEGQNNEEARNNSRLTNLCEVWTGQTKFCTVPHAAGKP
jgi:hypothetical protein